jgi:hypothetical protein
MKSASLLIFPVLFCFLINVSTAQSTFEYNSAKADTGQVVADAVSLPSGSLIFVGQNTTEDKTYGIMIKLSPAGDLIGQRLFAWHGKNTYIEKIIQTGPDRLIVIGGVGQASFSNLFVCAIDTALNETDSREYSLAPHFYYETNALIDHNNHVVVHGMVMDSAVSGNLLYPFLFKLSMDLDSIRSYFFNKSSFGIYDMIEKSDQTGYYLFEKPSFSVDSQGPAVLDLDYSFNIVKKDQVAADVVSYNTARWITDSTFIMSGEFFNNWESRTSIGILVTDSTFETLNLTHFGEDSIVNFPGFRRNLDFITPAEIYAGGTTKMGFASTYMEYDSWYFLNKFDSSLALTWQRRYGTPGYYYRMYGILATNDGGCVMYGTRYAYPTNSMTLDIAILKVDRNGFAVSADENLIIEPESAIIYPNPGTDIITVHTAMQNTVFVLSDCSNREILRASLKSGRSSFNTGNIPPGLYIYRIMQSGNVIQTGKWIKDGKKE